MKEDRSRLIDALQFSVCLLLGISGTILICVWPSISDNLIVLTPNSLLYKYWKKVPFDLPTDSYFFNWTNSEQVNNASVKPKFEEVGPYRFRQKEEKHNVTWNQNGTVTYRQQRFWYYDNSEKNGNLDDVIVTGNPLSITTSYISKTWNYYVRKGVFITLVNTGLLTPTVTQKVRNLMFDGYKEPLLKIAASLPQYTHLGIPKWDKFAWYYQRNGSLETDGVFEMGTGINSSLGKLYSWNYQTKTPYFNGACGEIRGTAGELFSKKMKKESVTIYHPDIRRTVTLQFVGEETVRGILGYKFVGQEYMLDNGSLYSENKCYCNGECMPSGVMDISTTRFGGPFFVSLPHFYGADPYYVNLVDGLKPNASKHTSYIIIEPATGIPIKMQVSLQFNLWVQPVPGTQIWETVPKFLLPTMWATQRFEIPKFDAFLLKLTINLSTICISIGTLLIVISIVLLGLMVYMKHVRRKIKQSRASFEEEIAPLKQNLKREN